jgi:hypothetical protein
MAQVGTGLGVMCYSLQGSTHEGNKQLGQRADGGCCDAYFSSLPWGMTLSNGTNKSTLKGGVTAYTGVSTV